MTIASRVVGSLRLGALCAGYALLVVACDDGKGTEVDLDADIGDAGPPTDTASDVASGTDVAHGSDGSDAPATCSLEELAPALEGAAHVAACTEVTHTTNPPASGSHFGTWAVFRAYDKPVPWGYLLHAMEHGAVVVAYNCPDGCVADVAAAKAVIAEVPRRTCSKPAPPVILVPDPKLATRFAATAWGHILRGECFDRAAFLRFINTYANKGPENIPGDCGVTDLEASGWCP